MAGNRIRSVRPDLLEHPRFAALSDGAVRLWTCLLSCWDDDGRSLGSVGYVAGRVYFARTKGKTVIGRELAELEDAGWLIRYEVAGVEYLAVPGWGDPDSPTYQYIKSSRPSKLPAPPSVPGAKPDAKPRSKPGAKPWAPDQEGEGDQEREGDQEGEADREGESHSRGDAPSPGFAHGRPASENPNRRAPAPPGNTGPTQADRSALRESLRADLEAARTRAGAARRVTVKPLLAFDRGIEADLTEQIERAATLAALNVLADQARHAIAMAEIEVTHGGNSFEWFTGAIFSGGNFPRLVGMTAEDAKRPRSTAKGEPPRPPPPRRPDPGPRPKEVSAGQSAGAQEVYAKFMSSYYDIATDRDEEGDQP